MNVTSLKSTPVWYGQDRPQYPELQAPAIFDVVVIGGGITGLTAAYLIKQSGKSVGVFEKTKICGADTGHTTAHLVYFTDLRLKGLIDTFGETTAQAVWQGGRIAVDLIEQIISQKHIECDFQRVSGYVHSSLFQQREESRELQEEAFLAQQLGFECAYHEAIPFGHVPGVEFYNQALFHPVSYLSGLASRIAGDGSQVFENSEMTEANESELTLLVNGHPVHFQHLVMATHVPLVGFHGLLSTMALQSKLYRYSTYVVGGSIPEGSLPYGSYNDTDDPYHYLRVSGFRGRDYAIFGGEDHKTGQADGIEERYARLERKIRDLIPGVMVDHRWSGQVVETNDGLPYIGAVNDCQFVASGYSGTGMTFGTLAGVMARDWVIGHENPWKELFQVNRKKIRGGLWDYLKENKDYPYELIKGYLSSGTRDDLESVGTGEGKVLLLNGQRRAIYRCKDGSVQNCSAICPHLGCVVKWNSGERTWDCPCHGSRFSTNGEVIAGPAESPLSMQE